MVSWPSIAAEPAARKAVALRAGRISSYQNKPAKRAEEAAKDVREAFHVQVRVLHSEAEAEKYWVIRRESFALLRQKVKGVRTAPFIDDFVVLPSYLPEFLPKLNQILGKYHLTYTIAGHVGDGNFHIIPLIMSFSIFHYKF